jgi:ribonuclease HII
LVFLMPCTLLYENQARARGYRLIAGVDEVGRGPLAGPVVAAAAILPPDFSLAGLTDSKKLRPASRQELADCLRTDSRVYWALGRAEVEEIDRLNILRASQEAMRRAILALPVAADFALIDGLPVRPFPLPAEALVKGDGLSLSIAAASVLAKVARDAEMLALDAEFPHYGFAAHKGYGTAAHLQALQTYGPCPHHRRSFAPVAQTFFAF